jgi:hypothetical protein
MLDFLGSGSLGADVAISGPEASGGCLELANVATSAEQVKCLFVNDTSDRD